MDFWIFALGLAALAATTLLLSLRRGQKEGPAARAGDLDVYRDQLREVDRDLARGILSPGEAERVRNEVSRRLLGADRAMEHAGAPREAPRWLTIAMAATLAAVVIGGAALVYLRLGDPGYGDQPMAARIAAAEEARQTRPSQAESEAALAPAAPRTDLDPGYLQLIERLRSVVADRPDDIRGLEMLARTEAGLGNLAAAHAVQAMLIAAKGRAATGQDHAELAELMILAAGGYISPEAEAALAEALALEPRNAVARYYQGLLHAQVGRYDLAFPVWERLLAEGPPGAPWVLMIRSRIEQLALLAGRNDFVLPPAPAARGPGAGDLAAAGELSPEERDQMVRGMVEGLAARLAAEGGPAADWARLIRAYGVLGEAESARPVLDEARTVFAADPAGLAAIESAARDAGLAP